MQSRTQHEERRLYDDSSPRPTAEVRNDVWPAFASGDVLIVLSRDKEYILHREVLMRISSRFRELLSDDRTVALSRKALRQGERIRNRLIAVENLYAEDRDGAGDGDSGCSVVLEPVELNEMGQMVHVHPMGVETQGREHLIMACRAFDRVLAAVYNQPINFAEASEDANLEAVINMAQYMTKVAEYLDCVEIVTKPIEAALFAYGQSLYQTMFARPCSWADFGARIHSFQIFRQSVIFAAGQANTKDVQTALPKLPADLRLLIESKAEIIRQGVVRATKLILSYYPREIQRERTVGFTYHDRTGRASYSNDIITWIALTVFRHWVTDVMVTDKGHHAADMGYAFLKVVSKSGDAYLDRNALNSFHRLFPMSTRGTAVLESKLLEIKEHVKRFATGFFVNNTQLNIDRHSSGFFFHTDVQHEELPWIKANEEARRQEVTGTRGFEECQAHDDELDGNLATRRQE